MTTSRIALLLTCHNRRDNTVACVESVTNQDIRHLIDLHIYLVDDGCTDGTAEAIRSRFPSSTILEGDGSLFWCGGMRRAFSEALKKDFDYYLWLNDDVRLYSCALRNLLDTSAYIQRVTGKDGITVGTLCDPEKPYQTYGGSTLRRTLVGFSFVPVPASPTPQECDVFNGNCVLIPRRIARSVGTLRDGFRHAAGDLDYGLRTSRHGFSSWVSPQYAGVCPGNPLRTTHRIQGQVPQGNRQVVLDPVARLRIHDWMIFTRYHCPLVWPIYWLRSLIHLRFPRLWVLVRSRTMVS